MVSTGGVGDGEGEGDGEGDGDGEGEGEGGGEGEGEGEGDGDGEECFFLDVRINNTMKTITSTPTTQQQEAMIRATFHFSILFGKKKKLCDRCQIQCRQMISTYGFQTMHMSIHTIFDMEF